MFNVWILKFLLFWDLLMVGEGRMNKMLLYCFDCVAVVSNFYVLRSFYTLSWYLHHPSMFQLKLKRGSICYHLVISLQLVYHYLTKLALFSKYISHSEICAYSIIYVGWNVIDRVNFALISKVLYDIQLSVNLKIILHLNLVV